MEPRRVLVADDDPELLHMVSQVLARLGLDVTTAVSGGELLDKVASDGPFDLVVTDVSMPWMSGLQVMHSARSAGAHCPVVVMTGLRDQKTEAEVHSLGTEVRRLDKPFAVADLVATVEGLLS